jgi:MFS family permease
MGISIILIPYSPNLWTLYLCFWVIGLSTSAWNNTNNVWLIELWPQNNAPVLQFSQFMFGIGTIFGPLIDRPYLTGETEFDFEDPINLGTNTSLIANTTFMTEDNERRSKLKTPFLITGIIQIIGIHLFFGVNEFY